MKISPEKKQVTLETILKHAYEAFTHENYENVKLSDISKAAHIAEGTLFNYFKDKPTLFIATFIYYRNGDHQVFNVYKPSDFESLMNEFMEILTFYMRIDHPKLEASFKRFLHILREQKLSSNMYMEQALLVADQYIYDAILELLEHSSLKQTNITLIFNVIVKQVEGIFNDYLYGDIDFDTFLSIVREQVAFILHPHYSCY